MIQFARSVPMLIRHLPNHRPWMVTLSFIAIAVFVTICGLGSYLVVRDNSAAVAEPSIAPSIEVRDISSRKNDPNPLTAAAIFPDAEITPDPSVPPYKRLGSPQVAKDCRIAATDDLWKFLVQMGCNQVVRASFVTPDGDYLLTAGIFNLRDQDTAVQAHGEIGSLINAGKGRLTGYVNGSATRNLGRAEKTQLAWNATGHFLTYIVIARADAEPFTPGDEAHTKIIKYDIVDRYLRDRVIAWATVSAVGSPSPSP